MDFKDLLDLINIKDRKEREKYVQTFIEIKTKSKKVIGRGLFDPSITPDKLVAFQFINGIKDITQLEGLPEELLESGKLLWKDIGQKQRYELGMELFDDPNKAEYLAGQSWEALDPYYQDEINEKAKEVYQNIPKNNLIHSKEKLNIIPEKEMMIKSGKLRKKKYNLLNLEKSTWGLDALDLEKYTWGLDAFVLEKMLYQNIGDFKHIIFDDGLEKIEKLENFFFHATTETNVIDILLEKAKPITAWKDRIFEDYEVWVKVKKYNQKQIDAIRKAREEGLYFFKSLRYAIQNSFVSVEKQGYDNPILILYQCFDTIYIDPEYECKEDGTLIKLEDYEEEENIPLMTFGKAEIVGILSMRKHTLMNDMIPVDVGSLLKRLKYEINEGENDLATFYDSLTLEDRYDHGYYNEKYWICKTRENKILREKGIFKYSQYK